MRSRIWRQSVTVTFRLDVLTLYNWELGKHLDNQNWIFHFQIWLLIQTDKFRLFRKYRRPRYTHRCTHHPPSLSGSISYSWPTVIPFSFLPLSRPAVQLAIWPDDWPLWPLMWKSQGGQEVDIIKGRQGSEPSQNHPVSRRGRQSTTTTTTPRKQQKWG